MVDVKITNQHLEHFLCAEDNLFLIVTSKYFMRNLLGEHYGRVAIEAVFLQLLKDINSFYTETPEVRYERYLTSHPDLQQRISQHIALFVGVSRTDLIPTMGIWM